ncbi:hypothetical protein N9281_01385, partial [bacterium]|nr:hypothetical protein [bacterium]
MGQVVATGTKEGVYFSLDGKAAVSKFPQPALEFIDFMIFDDPSFSDVNDGDGIVDSGETIELAVTIKNRWGKADPVTVTLAAQAVGAVGPDPFVTWDNDTVDYGAVGNFSEDDNGVIRDPEGLVTGVENPFRFVVSKDAFNNHIIPIKVSISAGNGFDAEDPNALYGFSGSFDLVVQRGRVLPSTIEEDLVMTKEDYWIIEKPLFIPDDVTLTITEGTQIQFWRSSKLGLLPPPKITVDGSFIVKGTQNEPVEFFNSALLPGYEVRLETNVGEDGVSLSYFKAINPVFTQGSPSGRGRQLIMSEYGQVFWETYPLNTFLFNASKTSKTTNFFQVNCNKVKFADIPLWFHYNPRLETCFLGGRSPLNWDIAGYRGGTSLGLSAEETPTINNTVFLDLQGRFDEIYHGINFKNNAILNNYWRNQKDILTFIAKEEFGGDKLPDQDFSGNFWGTNSLQLIGAQIFDKGDDFSLPDFNVEPILTDAPESCWPFVVDCVLSTELENDVSEVGAEEVTYTVTFNRDMDISIQPRVTFGPDDPVTDFTILGDWQDVRTWVGSFEINSITGDGYQQIRIQDAVAADDAWLVSGHDIGRFRFEIVTSGTEALTLQASGGEGFVDLSWGQDDFELLAGYNLYRGNQRINSSIVPAGTTSYRDTNVEPGQNYDYFFKVVLTDMSESESSNTATGTPLDTIPAVISHSAINSAQPNLARTIAADITDNVLVTGATLFYRLAGSGAEYTSREMVNATGDRFTVTLEGSLLQPPGIEYYLSAT